MSDRLQGVELRTQVSTDGQLRLHLEPVTLDPPQPGEVIVRVEATPVNPSDLALLFGHADVATLRREDSPDGSALVGTVPEKLLPSLAKRIGQSLPVGNEGAGTVVAAGAGAEHLLGKMVAAYGGAMYATYRRLPVEQVLALPEGASAADGASMFVNPLTALGFVETMRRDGHQAIVHTAAASNLGQMLVKICRADGIPLINIVRSEAQAQLLRGLGATHVIDSTLPDFEAKLTDLIAETGATLGFDATGGGSLVSTILNAMEKAISRDVAEYNRYGSDVPKQVYIYGMLDPSPTVIERRFGFAWNVGGWLLWPALRRFGPETAHRMRARIVDELKTTFASHYTRTISLGDLLDPEVARAAQKKATGEKILLNPSL